MIGSLGYVTVPVPGTPVRATFNRADPALPLGAQTVSFETLPDNTGLIYIGLPGMNAGTGVNVLAVLPAPADPTSGPFPAFAPSIPVIPAGMNAADFYIDASQAGDGVVIAYSVG